jgi:hypothetical protein
MISGVLVRSSLYAIASAHASLLSYADGQPHTLVDSLGRSWQNIIFRGEYQPDAAGPRSLAGGGWVLP